MSNQKKMVEFEIVDLKNKKTIINSLEYVGSDSNLVPEIDDNYIFNEYINDIIEDIKDNEKVCVVGHTGAGKTSGILQIAARIKQPVHRINLSDDVSVSDFVGYTGAKNGATVWINGALTEAMEKGHYLIIDEVDFGDSRILAILNSVAENNGVLYLKEKGSELIKPHPSFRMFTTANTIGCMEQFRPLYQGTKKMNEAFVDRFRIYKVSYLQPDQETDLMVNTFKKYYAQKYSLNELNFEKAKKNIRKMMVGLVSAANDIRSSFENDEVDSSFSTRKLIDLVKMTIRYKNPLVAAEISLYPKLTPVNQEIFKNAIEKYLKLPPKESNYIEDLFFQLEGQLTLTEMKEIAEKKRESDKAELLTIIKEFRVKKLEQSGTLPEDIDKELNKHNDSYIKMANDYLSIATETQKAYDEKTINFVFEIETLKTYLKKVLTLKTEQSSVLSAQKMTIDEIHSVPLKEILSKSGASKKDITIIDKIVKKIMNTKSST